MHHNAASDVIKNNNSPHRHKPYRDKSILLILNRTDEPVFLVPLQTRLPGQHALQASRQPVLLYEEPLAAHHRVPVHLLDIHSEVEVARVADLVTAARPAATVVEIPCCEVGITHGLRDLMEIHRYHAVSPRDAIRRVEFDGLAKTSSLDGTRCGVSDHRVLDQVGVLVSKERVKAAPRGQPARVVEIALEYHSVNAHLVHW
mmetsp:Transcript_1540/g.2145  ORF Transcript_1540/g.2145 Transcript_1540/m.2145 type:complete len:202 (-) Transcript_1540:847-1452(-)